MTVELDDDDTTPTGDGELQREIAAALAATPLGVVEWAAATAAGRRRGVNEDAWGHRHGVFVVADGMGGRSGGALAARAAIDGLLDHLPAAHHVEWRDVIAEVSAAVVRAGREQHIERLGTTLLAAVVGGPIVTLVHVGDSRAYRLGGGRLDALTSDHNVRAELLAAGLDVAEYRDRGVVLHGLTSYLGIEGDVLRVDVLAVPVRAGDRLLLCTDGIHRQLTDAEVRAALVQPSARRGADQLVHDAHRAGGRDDATALVLHVGMTAGRW